MRADGEVEQQPDLAEVRRGLEAAKSSGIQAAAIVFMHAYRFPEHERRLRRLAREIGFPQVSVSHEVSPLIKLVGRGDTTVVDAYLSPILRATCTGGGRTRCGQPSGAGSGARLMFMMSSGGLTAADLFAGKDAILSGPAGGVVGMAETGREAGFARVIGFDMGGTSTDVAHFDGEYERAFETEVAGVRMRAPMMLIHTVAAGGGSILHFDGARFRVGPDSAGADPGPAMLPPRRAAGRHRRQRDARQAAAGRSSPRSSGPGRTSRSMSSAVRADIRGAGDAEIGDGAHARGGGRRIRADRGRQHGGGDQEDLGRARLRRHAIRPQLLRRRGRAARLPRGRCARR